MAKKPAVLIRERTKSLEVWRSSLARSFAPMEVKQWPEFTGEFLATVERTKLGFLALSRVVSEPHIAERTESNVVLHPANFYKVSFQFAGSAWISQDGRNSKLEPGMLAIYDTCRPYTLEFPEASESIVAQIPHSEVPIEPSKVAGLTAQALEFSGPTSSAIVTILRAALEREDYGSVASDFHLARAVAELISSIIVSETPASSSYDPARDELLSSLKHYAEAHLSNSALSVEDAAAANFVSARTAQRLFRAEGNTFATWVRNQRLSRAYHQLTSGTKSITDIAYQCGFASATHFSRAFREKYGVSAREARRNYLED